MKRIMLFSLALFSCTAASAFAEDLSENATAKKLSLTVGAMYGFTLNGNTLRAAHSPGLTAVLGYDLTPRSTLLASWAHQAFRYGSDTITDDNFSLGYKYWLTDSQSWRPWVQVGAGYVWEKFDEEWLGSHYRYGTGNFQMNAGGGLRHQLTENIGIDASALLYKSGPPWKWNYSSKVLATSLGIDVGF
jgi:hypothetical protein